MKKYEKSITKRLGDLLQNSFPNTYILLKLYVPLFLLKLLLYLQFIVKYSYSVTNQKKSNKTVKPYLITKNFNLFRMYLTAN